jgi:hypothetical protein
MFLATTALLLQFLVLAVPNQALPTTAEAANYSAAPVAASVQPDAKPSDATAENIAPTPDNLSAAAEPEPNVAYMPGRLIPERVMPVTPAAPAQPAAFTVAAPALSIATEEKERRWEQRQKRIWLALDVTQSSAAAFDAWSTREVIASGQGQELNPMLRPFAGNDSLYAAIQVAPLMLDYIGHRMMMSHHSWARHTWWVPQAVGTAVSLAGGVNNLGVHSAP